MKSKSLITKLLAFMLCVMMVIGCLPVSAFAADDWESDIDVVEPAGSSAENPIEFEFGYRVDTYGFYYTESQSGETFYKTYGRNGEWTFEVSGEGSFSVNYNGETFAAVDGVVSIPVAFTPFANELSFSITGEGEFSLSVTAYIPEGSMNNPVAAQLGDNVASIEAGNTEGFFFTYTAEKAGNLEVTISAATGWSYTINNLTAGTYGDQQWNDSDPVVNPAVVEVAENDELQIIVNTYDPADMWNNPAGDITVNLAYQPEGPVADANLKFMQTALSLQEYIGLQGIITKAVYNSYDKVYLEVVQAAPEGEVTSTLTPFVYMTNYYIFDVQVLAWSMTEEVTMTLYAEKDGITYVGQTVTTSVEQKALSMLATYSTNEKQAATCRLLVDMLNYGAEVQKAFAHNIDSIPDASAYASLGTIDTPAFNATNTKTGSGAVSVLTHAVSMQAKVEIQTAFKGDVSAYVLRYTVDGVTEEIPASEFGTYYGYPFVAVAIKAANMRKNYTIALYDPATNQPVSPVYTTSIEGFAQTQLGGTYNDVFVAMMKYGDSVAAIA